MNKNLPKLLLLVLSLSTGLLWSQSIPEVLYYKFDGTGTTVPNLASAPPAGTTTANIQGSITQGGAVICNGSLIGSGNASSTDYLNTGWAPNLGTGSWSICFRTSGISTNGTLYYIFGDANTNSFRCFTNGVAGSTNWIIRGGGLTDTYINGGALATPTMCTFVYDQSLNQVLGYLNGTLVSTVAQVAPNITGTGPFKVMGYASNVGAPAGGLIDEFRVYSHALTPAEITAIYNGTLSPGFLGADQYTCPGDTTVLQLTVSSTNYLWSNGTTADSLLVMVADTFSVNVSGLCANGSDTIVYLSSVTSDSIGTTTCNALFTAPSGATYSSSGLYMDTIANAVGCDSIITINLNMISPSTNTISPATCASSYMAPSGAVLSSSGTYLDTIPNAAGCDSVITIDLVLNTNSTSSISPVSCGAYNSPAGNIYSIAGNYTDTILNAAGCDSIISINLTFTSVNVGVTQTGGNGQGLGANAVGATYQWIDCGTMAPIGGATSQNYLASANGSYAVIVTENSCTDTSACFVVAGLGINQNLLAQLVRLYPNPTKGAFHISFGNTYENVTVELTNNVGQVLKTNTFTQTDKAAIEINGAAGLYFVRILTSTGEKAILRIIKD